MLPEGKSEVVSALLTLEREKATGALDFRAQGVLTRIFVHEGVPVFAEAGVLGETLGNVLVREGILTSGQFAAVVRKMTDAIVDDENVRFGEVTVELGIMTQEDLERALATQVEKKIIGAITRGDGEWTFEPKTNMEVARHETPIRTLLVDAAKIIPEERLQQILQLDEETFPRLTEGAAKVASDYGLEDSELAALEHLQGTEPLKLVIAAAPGLDALVAALVLGGSVELLGQVQKPIVAPPQPPINATGRRRAFRAKLIPHAKGKEAVDRISRDLDVKEVARPVSISPRQATMFAEDDFQSARRLFLQGKTDVALQKIERALERSPTVPLYRLYEDFLTSRIKGAFADLGVTKRRATQLVKEDPECGFAFYVLGYVALEEGAHDQAKRFFRHAFKVDHEIVDAGRQVRLLEMRGDEPAPRPAAKPRADVPPNRTKILAGVLAAVVILAIVAFILLERH